MRKVITIRDYSLDFGYQDRRLYEASLRLKESLAKFGIETHSIYSNDQYITVEQILWRARTFTETDFFIWSNTDVVWNKDPFEDLDPDVNYGFHRTDQPSNQINYGVDAYRIKNDTFDLILSKDIPNMYVGGTHVDWYMSRSLARYSYYFNLTEYIDHPEHERYPGSAGTNEFGQTNLRNFNEWADKHGVSKE